METKAPTKFPFQDELIALIKKEVPLHSVYVMSVYTQKQEQTVQTPLARTMSKNVAAYTLLIIGHKTISKSLGDFMDDLFNRMQQQCKVYSIFYTLSNVKKRLNIGDNFLFQVINQHTCIYQENKELDKFKNYGPLRHKNVYEHIQGTWDCRMRRAEYLLSILDASEPNEDAISKLTVMHHALEQICLGLLYVFWEFKPHHYSLPYMLHLCNHFCTLPQTIFPRETYGLHRMFYILCNVHHIMRFKVENEFSKKDSDKALNRCERFYEEAKDLGDKHLEYIKEFHYQSLK